MKNKIFLFLLLLIFSMSFNVNAASLDDLELNITNEVYNSDNFIYSNSDDNKSSIQSNSWSFLNNSSLNSTNGLSYSALNYPSSLSPMSGDIPNLFNNIYFYFDSGYFKIDKSKKYQLLLKFNKDDNLTFNGDLNINDFSNISISFYDNVNIPHLYYTSELESFNVNYITKDSNYSYLLITFLIGENKGGFDFTDISLANISIYTNDSNDKYFIKNSTNNTLNFNIDYIVLTENSDIKIKSSNSSEEPKPDEPVLNPTNIPFTREEFLTIPFLISILICMLFFKWCFPMKGGKKI